MSKELINAMIRRFAKLLTFTALLLINMEASSQDVTISQFMANPLFLNPALAGSNSGPRATIMYRNQWPALDANFQTYSASYDQNLEAINSGFGASFLTNKIGGDALVTAVMSAYYAYQMKPSDDFQVNLGLKGTYFQKRLNASYLSQPAFDTLLSMIGTGADANRNTTVKNYDFAIGATVNYKDVFYAGLAAEHLLSPDISFYEGDTLSSLGLKLNFYAGANINLRKKELRGTYYTPTIISPTIFYQGRTGFQQLSIGTFVNHGPIFGGGWYRMDFNNEAALVGMIGGKFREFILAYSFDYTMGSTTGFDGGAHEITLTFQISNDIYRKSKSTKLGPIPSPGF